MAAGDKYRPSNGTEGMYFVEEFCMNCFYCDPNPQGKTQCEILCASFVHEVDHPNYPKEWVQDEKGHGKCTKWQKWDWGNDGDPNAPDNPKRPIPDDPMQLCLPFEIETINQNIKNEPRKLEHA